MNFGPVTSLMAVLWFFLKTKTSDYIYKLECLCRKRWWTWALLCSASNNTSQCCTYKSIDIWIRSVNIEWETVAMLFNLKQKKDCCKVVPKTEPGFTWHVSQAIKCHDTVSKHRGGELSIKLRQQSY